MTKAAPSSSSSLHSYQLIVPSATGGSSQPSSDSYNDASPATTPVKGDGMSKAAPSESSSSSSANLSEYLPAKEDATVTYPIPLVRSQILRLSVLVGQLSALALQHLPFDGAILTGPDDDANTADGKALEISSSIDRDAPTPRSRLLPSAEARAAMTSVVSQVWLTLVAASALLSLRLPRSILEKMELNRRKYPVELCRGKAGKYTDYSDATGITKDHGQTTSVSGVSRPVESVVERDGFDDDDACDPDVVKRLTATIREFASERQWSTYHLPRNLLLALLGEVGELAEIVQWNGDRDDHIAPKQLDKLSQELADVAIYLLRVVDICGLTIDVDGAQEGA